MNDDHRASLRALVTRLYWAITTGDAEALKALLHSQFRGQVTDGLPMGVGGGHTGPEAMRDEVWWTMGRYFRVGISVQSADFLEDGRLLVLGRYQGEGRRSRLPLDAEFFHLIGFTDDRISSIHQLTDSARFLQALGEGA